MNRISGILSALAGFAIARLGGWDAPLMCLVSVMAADFALGILTGIAGKSGKSPTGKLSSGASFLGLVRKCAMLTAVLAGTCLDTLAGTGCVRDMIIVSFFISECISITENLGRLGVRVPKALRKAIEAFTEDDY